jgi:hypothetical protein
LVCPEQRYGPLLFEQPVKSRVCRHRTSIIRRECPERKPTNLACLVTDSGDGGLMCIYLMCTSACQVLLIRVGFQEHFQPADPAYCPGISEEKSKQMGNKQASKSMEAHLNGVRDKRPQPSWTPPRRLHPSLTYVQLRVESPAILG